jgi:predicted MFS family arabinose efflux permease
VISAVGSGAGSFSVLIGAASRHLTVDKRGKAAGIINAGGSLGQFVFAPVAQTLIQILGWMGAMWSLAVITVGALPLVRVVSSAGPVRGGAVAIGSSPWQAVRTALEDRSYLLLHAGFFTCGFHIAFLVTHLPGEVNLCGLPPAVASWSLALIGLANIVGSLIAGACTQRFRSKYILAAMYGSRTLLIGWYLVAPKTRWTFYAFAVGLGLTWLATVPPTATIVAKLFGIRYLSTLFGLTLLSHQIGGFLGAYLGGLALVRFGDYQWMWYADMALAAAAALINLPIRETRTHAAFASSP